MALILNIETSSYVCSVVLSKNGGVVSQRESREDKTHAALLTSYIEEIFKETNLKATDLDAVAVSKGPGSYTGLRIGTSSAKGICYGAGLPLISVCSLHSMTYGVQPDFFVDFAGRDTPVLLCPMIDARRMEVYAAFYGMENNQKTGIKAIIIDETSFSDELDNNTIVFFGNGAGKCKNTIRHENARFIENFHPSARFMIEPAEAAYKTKDFENTAYFEPFYLKDFVPTIPRKNMVQNM